MFEALEKFDRYLLLKINAMHSPFFDGMMFYISDNSWPTVLIILATAFVFYRKYALKKAIEFLVGCAIVFACTDLSTNLVKHAVKRYRPTHNHEIKEQVRVVNDYHGGKYGFFSAHAANTFSVMTFIFFCVHWISKKYRLLFFVYPVLVTYSRMYLGVHYPSDTITGIFSGLIFGRIVFLIMNKHFLKFDVQKV
ncbi:MAG: phosphatase PAP2 family protein [Bacteroidota bacterium]